MLAQPIRTGHVDRAGGRRYIGPIQRMLGRSQVVRQRILRPPSPGSNPGAPASLSPALPGLMRQDDGSRRDRRNHPRPFGVAKDWLAAQAALDACLATATLSVRVRDPAPSGADGAHDDGKDDGSSSSDSSGRTDPRSAVLHPGDWPSEPAAPLVEIRRHLHRRRQPRRHRRDARVGPTGSFTTIRGSCRISS